jgi:L-serine dehydratase
MNLSVLELFTIGIGPSSSHTVGPMRAGRRFVDRLQEAGVLARTERVEAHLYGSLALTGKGHGTDRAVLFGLEGETPEGIELDTMAARLEAIRTRKRLKLGGTREIDFDEKSGMLFHRMESLPAHPNGLRFVAFDAAGVELMTRTYYSIGGGFVVNEGAAQRDELSADQRQLPFPFRTGDEMLRMGAESGLSVSEMTLRNEAAWRPEAETRAALLRVAQAMQNCIERGCHGNGVLPGGLKVPRRAPGLYRGLAERAEAVPQDPLLPLDWVSLWAIAVNEENAAGGRVVTAPTNGAAGILPAVLQFLIRVHKVDDDDRIVRFLLTAGAIGILYKLNASISGAEVGCQGEVGVACSMAAGALCEALGGTVPKVENAAEIGMEHNLGLTCDPVGGLVQVPCIERNAMGAVKAINAARLALHGDGTHRVSLDRVIATMRQTGADMSTKYKETSRGGLAVNVTEC